MSSAGHILDMIKRISQNRALRPSNRRKFKGDNRENIYSGTEEQDKAVFNEFPQEQVDQVVNQIKQDFKKKRRKELNYLIIFSSLIVILIIYALLRSSENPEIKNTPIEYNSSPPIIWSGKRSDPLQVPFSNLYYSPFIGNMEFEVEIDKSFTLYNDNMVIDNTTNVLFFDSECNLIGKLLPKNGYISLMFVGPGNKDLGPIGIIYVLAEKDTNNDGLVNANDRRYLYFSNPNGTELTKITERGFNSFQWGGGLGDKIQIIFTRREEKYDSIYGLFDTKTKELELTNKPLEK